MNRASLCLLLLLLPLAFATEEAELTWLNCCCPLTIIVLPLLAIVFLRE
jgi:hypothetical protein